MDKPLGHLICEAESVLRGERSTWESLWQEISDYCWPEKAEFTVKLASGVERNRGLLDSTGARALELFGSSMHNMLNNPNSKWFKVSMAGLRAPSVKQKQDAERTENELLVFMSHPSARLYQNLHVNYLDLGGYGTSNLFTELVGRFLRTEEIHLRDYVFEEDAFGFPSIVYRKREYTYDQARQRFGEDALKDENGQDPESRIGFLHAAVHKVCFLHAMMPAAPQAYALSRKFDKALRRAGDNFLTAWVNTDTKRVFEQQGHQTPPYIVTRWYRNGSEKYGRSPAMTALPDIRMANRMMDTILRGSEKIVDPPWFVRDGSLMSPLRLFSGGLTFGDGDPPQPLIPPGASRIEMGNALLEQRQQAVREAFFVPLFATPDSPVKTATQVLQEVDERNRAISPMLVRVQEELHNNLISRCYDLGVQAGMVSPLPDELLEQGVRIEYLSPLAASRHQLEALGTIRMFEGLALLAQISPEVFDEFDVNKAAHVIHAGSGAPMDLRRNEAEKRALRAAREQQMQQAQALQALQQGVIPAVEASAKMTAATRPRG